MGWPLDNKIAREREEISSQENHSLSFQAFRD